MTCNAGNNVIHFSNGNYEIAVLNKYSLTYLTASKQEGIFSIDNFLSLFNDWLDRIGTDNFEKEYEKWPEAPCNRDDKVDTTHWKRSNTYTRSISKINYDDSKTYQVGEKCYFGFDNVFAFEFECIAESTGNPPLTQAYNSYPKTLGYRDSLWRLVNYIKQRLEKENDFINKL